MEDKLQEKLEQELKQFKQEVMDVMLNHPLAQYKIADALAYCA